MVNAFTIYDLSFFALFTLFVIVFLYTHRKNLKRQGILYLYRTKIGLNFIEKVTKRLSYILRPLQYLVVATGFVLMITMVWLLIKFTWIYLTSPFAAQALKVPVLIPLIPYLPDIFKIDFLPSFNFTYWIIIIAIIAIPHEFAHGIFARLHKIKVRSTGFGFLGPFLAAFVEPDEKQTEKLGKFAQMSILAAGTFANILSTILFGLLLWGFFALAFVPAGVNFNAYAASPINVTEIEEVNGVQILSLSQIPPLLNESLAEIKVKDVKYHAPPSALKTAVEENIELMMVYDDSPAFNAKLKGAITEINGEKITSYDLLSENLGKYSSGDTIQIKTLYQETVRVNKVEELTYDITLKEKNDKAFLGIGIAPITQGGALGYFYSFMAKIKDPVLFYQSSWGALGWFIYYLLWWIVVICLSVALVNMLPLGLFDGGRFFYLTIWGLTGSKIIGKKFFELSTWLILGIVVAMMLKWVLIFF